jgi:uncharacterized membrane protein affecting hemolysin expression
VCVFAIFFISPILLRSAQKPTVVPKSIYAEHQADAGLRPKAAEAHVRRVSALNGTTQGAAEAEVVDPALRKCVMLVFF